MIDDLFSSQLILAPNVEQELIFSGITKLVFLENKSFEPVFVYWKDETGNYNSEPAI